MGQGRATAGVLGIAGAMSSTAVVVQVLAEEKRLASPVGRTSFAILLFQDLAVVPVLFALGMLDPKSHGAGLGGFGVAVAQAVAAVAAIAALGRLGLRPLVPQRRAHPQPGAVHGGLPAGRDRRRVWRRLPPGCPWRWAR